MRTWPEMSNQEKEIYGLTRRAKKLRYDSPLAFNAYLSSKYKITLGVITSGKHTLSIHEDTGQIVYTVDGVRCKCGKKMLAWLRKPDVDKVESMFLDAMERSSDMDTFMRILDFAGAKVIVSASSSGRVTGLYLLYAGSVISSTTIGISLTTFLESVSPGVRWQRLLSKIQGIQYKYEGMAFYL